MARAVTLLDAVTHPVSPTEIQALLSLLPADGDPAQGLNWTILHIIEAAPSWPIWDFLRDDKHEWIETFRFRLKNGGIFPPESAG